MYGPEKHLKEILKKLKLRKMEVKDLSFFKALSDNFAQKIFIHFGNKLRIYEKISKDLEKNEMAQAFNLL